LRIVLTPEIELEGKLRRTWRKTLVARERTNKQLNSHEIPKPRITHDPLGPQL
jgi:hypothetical protein